jgi:hypothetical protein
MMAYYRITVRGSHQEDATPPRALPEVSWKRR